MTQQQLKELGAEAAREIAGADAFGDVDISTALDALDRPAYVFRYLLDPGRAKLPLGLLYIRLVGKLADELDERGEECRAMIEMHDQAGWLKRPVAKFY